MTEKRNFPMPGDSSMTEHVRMLFQEKGVFPEEIRRRGVSAGWAPQSINRALRKAGHRTRNVRSDKGLSKGFSLGPSAEQEAQRLLGHFGTVADALSFISEVRQCLTARRSMRS